jgi:hypothetical protein
MSDSRPTSGVRAAGNAAALDGALAAVSPTTTNSGTKARSCLAASPEPGKAVGHAGSQTLTMWSAADPAKFRTMQITAERADSGGQYGIPILTGTAQT